MRTVEEISQPGACVALRVDLETNKIDSDFTNHAKHKVHTATINHLHENDTKTLILAHDRINEKNIMQQHSNVLSEYCEPDINYIGGQLSIHEVFDEMKNGDVYLYKNLDEIEGCMERYESTEESSNVQFVRDISKYIDAYVNDDFSLTNCMYPTVIGIPSRSPGYAGKNLSSEYSVLDNITKTSEDPILHFSGSERVDEKIKCIRQLMESDNEFRILTSGFIGNIFLLADGYELGSYMDEKVKENSYQKQVDIAFELLTRYGASIYLPVDVVVDDSNKTQYATSATPLTDPILDIGSETLDMYEGIIKQSEYTISTGVNKYNDSEYTDATKSIYKEVSDTKYGIIAGDETIVACDKMGLTGFTNSSMDFAPICDYLVDEDNLVGINSLLP